MQRSLYLTGYLNNENLNSESFYSPNRSGMKSYNFLRELEKHHDRSVQIADDRFKAQEIQHERNLENLRNQVLGSKQQLELNDRTGTREEQRLEEDYKYRLNLLQRECDLRTRPVLAQIAEYEKNPTQGLH